MILILFINKNKSEEYFINQKKNIFFDNEIFNNKKIFLIANNPNLTKKTVDFVKKHKNDKNSLFIRFNNRKPNKELRHIQEDIMFYRHNSNGVKPNLNNSVNFHDLNKITFKQDIYNVFVSENVDNNKFNYTKFFNQNKFIDKNNSKLYFMNINKPNEEYNLKKYSWGYTSGVNSIIGFINRNKYDKLYLVGFSMHEGKDISRHNLPFEHKFINNLVKTNKNIKIIL